MQNKVIIYSDGSSRGNPGSGGWGCVVIKSKVYKGRSEVSDGIVEELGGREEHTTNNRMELAGAISALSLVKDLDNEIIVNTDSSYVINGITKWIYGWQKNDWKTEGGKGNDVVNRDLWEDLIVVSKGKNIKWNYVGGHIGVPGNERCDEIATSFADGLKPELFKGKISDYKVDVLNLVSSSRNRGSSDFNFQGNDILKEKKSKSKKPAYSYLSLVDGVLEKHKTWAECEKRVRGVKGGVKFQKAISEEDEKEIVKNWGIS